MPSTRLKTTKDRRDYYEIRVSRGRGQSYLTTRWYVPKGWSKKAIEKELTAQAAEFERKVKAGEVISKAEQKEIDLREKQKAEKIQTLRQYSEKVFMPELTVRCSENTRDSYQHNINTWIVPALGDLKLPDITAANINALLLSMASQGKSQSTCVKVYTILQGLFKSAYKADIIPRNPMDKVDRPKPRKDEVLRSGVEAYTIEEVHKILTALNDEPLRWQAYIRLLIDTGIRRGEACGLQWKYVDFKDNTITIAGNLCYTPQKGVYLDTPKSKRCRTIGVDSEVIKLLRELRSRQPILTPYVFAQDNGDPMNPQTPTRYMQKFADRCGVPHLHPHALRHTFASIAITSGADVASVSEILGHADKAITLRIYAHADEDSKNRASNIFREAIKGF